MSVVLTTHERPHLLSIALACFAHQTYPERELIVVDDGPRFPALAHEIDALGGRLLRLDPGTPLGAKLNHGVEVARGELCLKMDDDDWYAPEFLATMVAAHEAFMQETGQPAVAGVCPFLFFDVARWEVRLTEQWHVAGGTILFSREIWQRQPFRPIPKAVDSYFMSDLITQEVTLVRVPALEVFLNVRHAGHIWNTAFDQPLMEYVRSLALYERTPEQLLPDWALRRYRMLHSELTATGAER